MRLLLSLLPTFFCLLAFQPLNAEKPPAVAPEEWLPALFPSIQSALGHLKEAETQAEMNALSRQVAEMTDAQLYIAYVRLYQALGSKDRAALLAEQTEWLEKRQKAARAGVKAKGGSLAPLEANNAEVTLTEERLRELRARLKAITHEEE